MTKYDAILYLDNEYITEDERSNASRSTQAVDKYFQGSTNYDDPALYNSFSFGQQLKSRLNNSDGFYCEVTDFKKWVTVRMSHHNTITGRTSSKTFLIVFKQKGDGIVLNTHNRYRTISGVDQAASYIKSAASVLQSANSSKL